MRRQWKSINSEVVNVHWEKLSIKHQNWTKKRLAQHQSPNQFERTLHSWRSNKTNAKCSIKWCKKLIETYFFFLSFISLKIKRNLCILMNSVSTNDVAIILWPMALIIQNAFLTTKILFKIAIHPLSISYCWMSLCKNDKNNNNEKKLMTDVNSWKLARNTCLTCNFYSTWLKYSTLSHANMLAITLHSNSKNVCQNWIVHNIFKVGEKLI